MGVACSLSKAAYFLSFHASLFPLLRFDTGRDLRHHVPVLRRRSRRPAQAHKLGAVRIGYTSVGARAEVSSFYSTVDPFQPQNSGDRSERGIVFLKGL